jgi:hypothetical protein
MPVDCMLQEVREVQHPALFSEFSVQVVHIHVDYSSQVNDLHHVMCNIWLLSSPGAPADAEGQKQETNPQKDQQAYECGAVHYSSLVLWRRRGRAACSSIDCVSCVSRLSR